MISKTFPTSVNIRVCWWWESLFYLLPINFQKQHCLVVCTYY